MTMLPEQIRPYEGTDPYIFISYAHRDKDRVLPVLRSLSERGYRIWFDEGIDPGTEWAEQETFPEREAPDGRPERDEPGGGGQVGE